MFLSRKIDIKRCQNYTKTCICKICSIKQIIINKYATNSKMTISKRSLRNSGLGLLLFEFNHFSFFRHIINNIIYTYHVIITPTNGMACHQNSNQWQCSINVTSLRLYHVTSILHCHWREFGSRDTDVYLPCIRFGIILTDFFCQFLDTRTSDRYLTGLVQLLRFSG